MRRLLAYHLVASLGIAGLLAAPGVAMAQDAAITNARIIVGNGTVIDSGTVIVRAGRIVSVSAGAVNTQGLRVIDAKGMAVAPGFVNMLSWAPDSLYVDGRSLSDIKQGVTLEVFGEGESLGPLTDEIRKANLATQGDLKHPIDWTTLGEGLDTLAKRACRRFDAGGGT